MAIRTDDVRFVGVEQTSRSVERCDIRNATPDIAGTGWCDTPGEMRGFSRPRESGDAIAPIPGAKQNAAGTGAAFSDQELAGFAAAPRPAPICIWRRAPRPESPSNRRL